MPVVFITLSFILGTIVGSFLNVVGLRWNSGATLQGRSFCFSCRKQLRWWELVPVLSFFVLRARCSSCKAQISWQYPLVEIWMGVVFATLFAVIRPSSAIESAYFALAVVIFSIYTVILIYDSKHKIIPDELVYASIPLAVVAGMLNFHSAIDWIAGPVIFAVFALAWLLSRGRALGFGDAKLGLSIGLFLGAGQGVSAVVLAFWIGAVVAVLWMIMGRKKLTMKSEIPFGPFMIIGAWLSMILNLDLLYVSAFF